MPSTRVVDVLAEVFRTYGFDTTTQTAMDGQSGTRHTVPLLAEKEGLDAVIHVHVGQDALGMDQVDQHDRTVRDIGARYGVLVTTGTFTESAYAHATRTRTILWDQADLEAVIGKAVLHEVIGDPEADHSIAEVLAHGRQPEAEAESTMAPPEPHDAHLPTHAATEEHAAEPTPAHDLHAVPSVADTFGAMFGDDPESVTTPSSPPTTTPSTQAAAPDPAPERGVIIDAEQDMPLSESLALERHAQTPPTEASSGASSAPGFMSHLPQPGERASQPNRTPIIDAEADDTPILSSTPTEGTAPTPPEATPRGRTPIIDAEARPEAEPTTNRTAPSPPPERVQGRGWVLETANNTVASDVIDATNDPDPVPIPARPKRSLATMAALGGTTRVPKGSGPDPRVFNPAEGALLAPAISKEQAATAVRDRIYTIDDTRLRYHPKRVYRWTVEAFVEGQVTTTTLTGVRVVDLATRHVAAPEVWQASRHLREGTFDVPVDHKPVRIEGDKAASLALDSVLDETAREITVEDWDQGLDIMVTEKKQIRTHRDDVQLTDDGLQWCPVWCFTGVNGEVEVDALSGEVVHEQLEARTSNTILL